MSASVPESTLTKAELAKLAHFRAELADALDTALADGGGTVGPGTAGAIPLFATTTTIGDSHISDDGDIVTITKRTRVTTDLAGAGSQHAGLQVLCNGVALVENDGGVQSFQQSTYNCTAAPVQSIAVYAGNTCSRSAGANALTNVAVFASASGGQNNYSFIGYTGFMQQNEGAQFNVDVAGVTIGSGATSAGVGAFQVNANMTVEDAHTCSLGNNVANFIVPGSSSVTPRIILSGASAAAGEQFVMKNTVAGSQTSGMSIGLDTTVDAGVRGGLFLWRGAGGGIGGANEAGFAFSAGSDFLAGAAAGDLCIFNTTPGKKILFGSDGSGFTVGLSLDSAGKTTASSLLVTGNVGFYNTAPIAKQTGVAVTAGGIHAALVALGLIAA